jgi:hypothetical protein
MIRIIDHCRMMQDQDNKNQHPTGATLGTLRRFTGATSARPLNVTKLDKYSI